MTEAARGVVIMVVCGASVVLTLIAADVVTGFLINRWRRRHYAKLQARQSAREVE